MRASSALGIGGAAIFFCSFNPALRTGLIRVHSGQESRTAPDRELEDRVYSYVLDDLDNLFAQIKREKGRLDIVHANAGGSFAPIGGITEQHFEQTFDRNVKGTLFTVQKALPLGPDGESIIMTASTAGSTAMPAFQRLLRLQSGNTILCPLPDAGFERPQNPPQRRQSRTYRNSGHRESCAERRTAEEAL